MYCSIKSIFQAPVIMKWGKLCLEKLRNWTRLHLAARIVPTNRTEGPMWQGILKDTTLPTLVWHVCTVVKHLLPIMPWTLMCRGSTEIQNKCCPFPRLLLPLERILYFHILTAPFLGSVEYQRILDLVNSKIVTVSRGEFRCTDCEHICKTKQNMQKHIEARHLEKVEHACPYCGHICTNRWALGSHINKHHRM